MDDLISLEIARRVFWESRYQHLNLLGASGTGKTSLESNMIEQDSLCGYSVFAMEPTGTAAPIWQTLLNGHYLSLKNPLSLNFFGLDYNPNIISDIGAEALNQVIQLTAHNEKLTSAMRAAWDDGVKACLTSGHKSLRYLLRYFENEKFSTAIEGIKSRLRHILSDDRMEPILCGENPIDIGKLIENGESLVVDLSGTSEDRQIMVGNLLTQLIKSYYLYKCPKNPKPVAIYIDECQHYVSANMFFILKEGRKWKISMVLSTQDLAVIPKDLVRVMLNVGNKISFRVEDKEAYYMGKSMNVSQQKIMSQDDFHFFYKFKNKVGEAKTLRPPEVEPFEVAPNEIKTGGWFPLEPH